MTKYPIELTVERLKTERGLDITALYGNRAQAFLSDVHVAVYEGCIYATGAREIKDRFTCALLKGGVYARNGARGYGERDHGHRRRTKSRRVKGRVA